MILPREGVSVDRVTAPRRKAETTGEKAETAIASEPVVGSKSTYFQNKKRLITSLFFAAVYQLFFGYHLEEWLLFHKGIFVNFFQEHLILVQEHVVL
jgi:hypothetical protein